MPQPLATLYSAVAFRRLCEEAVAAASAGLSHCDGESLHDFRVALRRLRGVVGYYACDNGHRDTMLRHLKRLTVLTNGGRDNEVMLAWLEQQWPSLDALDKSGARRWHRILLRERKHTPPFRYLAKRVAGVARLLPSLIVDEEAVGQPFGVIAARMLRREAELLLGLMERSDPEQMHPLRLQVKRVRYLLYPFRGELEACGLAEQQLRQLQELLGEWHDSVVIRQALLKQLRKLLAGHHHEVERTLRAGKPLTIDGLLPELHGVVTLARRNLERQKQLMAALQHDYFAERGKGFDASIEQAAIALHPESVLSDPHRLP